MPVAGPKVSLGIVCGLGCFHSSFTFSILLCRTSIFFLILCYCLSCIKINKGNSEFEEDEVQCKTMRCDKNVEVVYSNVAVCKSKG